MTSSQTGVSAIGELIMHEIHSKAAKHLSQSSSSSTNDYTINATFHSILVGLAVFPKDIQSCVAYHHYKKYNNNNQTNNNNSSRPAKLNLLVVCGGNINNSASSPNNNSNPNDNSNSFVELDPIHYEAEQYNTHNQHQILQDLHCNRGALNAADIDDYYNHNYHNHQSSSTNAELQRVAFPINGTPDQRVDAYTKLMKKIVNDSNNKKENQPPSQVEYVGVISSKFLVADILHKRISLCLLGGVVFIYSHRATSIEKFALSLLQPQDAFEESALIMSMSAGGHLNSKNNNNATSTSSRRSSRWGLFLTNHIPSISRQLLSTLNVLQVQLYPRCRVCIDDWMTRNTRHARSILEDFISPAASAASSFELVNVIKTVFGELVEELNRVILFSSDKYDSVRSMMELIGNDNPISTTTTTTTSSNSGNQPQQHQQQQNRIRPCPTYITKEALVSPLAFHLLKRTVRNLPSTSRCRDICESLLHVRRMLRLAPRLDSGTFLAVLECIAAEALITRAYSNNSNYGGGGNSAFSSAAFTSLYDTLLWLASPSSTRLLNLARRRAYEFDERKQLRINIDVPPVYLRVRQLLARIISRNPPTIAVAAAKDGKNSAANHARKKSVVLIIVPNRHDCGATVLDDVRMSVSLNTIADVKRAMIQRFVRRFNNNNNKNNNNHRSHPQDQQVASTSEDAALQVPKQPDEVKQQQQEEEENQKLFVNDGDDMMMLMTTEPNIQPNKNSIGNNNKNNKNSNDSNGLSVKSEQRTANNRRIANDDLFGDDDDDDDDNEDENGDGDAEEDNNPADSKSQNQQPKKQIPLTFTRSAIMTQQNPLGILSNDLKTSLTQQRDSSNIVSATNNNNQQQQEEKQSETIQEQYDEENLNSRTQHERSLLLKQETDVERSQQFQHLDIDDDNDETRDNINPRSSAMKASTRKSVSQQKQTQKKQQETKKAAARHSIVDVDALSDEDDDVMIVGVTQKKNNLIADETSEKEVLDLENLDEEEVAEEKLDADDQPNEIPTVMTSTADRVVSKTLIDPEAPAHELQLYADSRIESLPSFIQRRREILSARQQQQQQQQTNNNHANNNSVVSAASAIADAYRRPLHQFTLPAPQNLSRDECWRYVLHDEGVDVVCATLNAVNLNLLREVLDPSEYKKSRQVFCLDVNLNFLRTLELFQAEEGLEMEQRIAKEKENQNNGNNKTKNQPPMQKPAKIHVRIIAEQGSACHEDVLHEIDEERNAVKRVSFYSKTHTPRLIYRSLQPASTMMSSMISTQGNNDDDDDDGEISMANLMMMNTIQNLNNNNNNHSMMMIPKSTSASSSMTVIPPTVLVDDRELRAELPLHLHEAGLRIIPLTLVRGDYIISRDIAIERKAVSDLCQSLRSGRLNNQLSAMQAFFRYAMILVELSNGHGAAPALSAEFIGQQPGMKEMLAKLVLNTNRINGGNGGAEQNQNQNQQQYPKQICILWSSGPAHSARIIMKLKNTFAISHHNSNNNNNNNNNNNEPDASDPSLVSDSLTSASTSANSSKITKIQQSFCESAGEVFHRLPGCAFVNVNRMIRQQQNHIDEKEEREKAKRRKDDDDDEDDNDDDDELTTIGGKSNQEQIQQRQMSQMVNNLTSLVLVSKNQKKLEQMFIAGSMKHPSATASATAAALELMNFLHTPLIPPIVL